MLSVVTKQFFHDRANFQKSTFLKWRRENKLRNALLAYSFSFSFFCFYFTFLSVYLYIQTVVKIISILIYSASFAKHKKPTKKKNLHWTINGTNFKIIIINGTNEEE